jgi:hypothetical protein
MMILAIIFGCVVAFADSRLDAPGFPSQLLIGFCFFLGFVRPRRPWRWALVLTGCLLAGNLLRMSPFPHWFWVKVHLSPLAGPLYDRLGRPTEFAPTLGEYIALAPALAAAYLGQLVHFWSRRERSDESGLEAVSAAAASARRDG